MRLYVRGGYPSDGNDALIRFWGGGDEDWLPKPAPDDTVSIGGRFSVHLCGPWDYGAPLRLHVNWSNRSRAGKVASPNKLHVAVALCRNGRFGARVQDRRQRSRWWLVSWPAKERRAAEAYTRRQRNHPSGGSAP